MNGTDVVAAQPGRPAAVMYEVVRILKFANGCTVPIALAHVYDEAEANTLIQHENAKFQQRMNTPTDPMTRILAEFGIVGCSFGALTMKAPESRIIMPLPGLQVPRV